MVSLATAAPPAVDGLPVVLVGHAVIAHQAAVI